MERTKGFIIDDDPRSEELKGIARTAIRSALVGYDVSRVPDRLIVKQSLDGGDYFFELCVAGASPAEDKILASARVNPTTRQATVRVVGLERSGT